MSKTSPKARRILAVGYGLAGVCFFFSIIGVFGLAIAIGSLLLFIVVTVLSTYQTADGES